VLGEAGLRAAHLCPALSHSSTVCNLAQPEAHQQISTYNNPSDLPGLGDAGRGRAWSFPPPFQGLVPVSPARAALPSCLSVRRAGGQPAAGRAALAAPCSWPQVHWRAWAEPPARVWLLFPLSRICLASRKQTEKLRRFWCCGAQSCARAGSLLRSLVAARARS